MKTKISIVIEGGIIQEIKSNNKNIDLKIFDYDNAEDLGNSKDLEIVETVERDFLPHRSDYSSVEELEAAVIADYESFARLRAEYEADVVGTEW